MFADSLLDGSPVALAVAALFALLPGLLAWWWGRGLIARRDEPLLAERWMAVRQRTIKVSAVFAALIVVFGGSAFFWLFTLLIVATVAGGLPTRRAVLGETWGLLGYLWLLVRWHVALVGFWVVLMLAPGWIGLLPAGWRLLVGATAAFLFVVWSRSFTRVVGWILGVRPLAEVRSDLVSSFEAVRARSEVPAVEVGVVPIRGGRLANAFALSSLRRPTVLFTAPLLEVTSPAEATAIHAHELAHLEHHRGPRLRRLVWIETSLVALGTLVLPAHVAGDGVLASWLPVAWPVALFGFLISRLAGRQQQEHDSDLRALALVRDAEALVGGLVKVHYANLVPRRWDLGAERASTHPSLARRIQAIRRAAANAGLEIVAPGPPVSPAPADDPAVPHQSSLPANVGRLTAAASAAVAARWAPGAWVVLDAGYVHWLSGLPLDAVVDAQGDSSRDAPGDLSATVPPLAELAVAETAGADPASGSSQLEPAAGMPARPTAARRITPADLVAAAATAQRYAYRQLVELRVAPSAKGAPELVCRDLAGRRWTTPLGAADVAAVEAHLNLIDGQLAPLAMVSPEVGQQPLARAVAGLAAAVGLLPGVSWLVAIAGALALVAPRMRQLTWLGAACLAAIPFVWVGRWAGAGGGTEAGSTLLALSTVLAVLGVVELVFAASERRRQAIAAGTPALAASAVPGPGESAAGARPLPGFAGWHPAWFALFGAPAAAILLFSASAARSPLGLHGLAASLPSAAIAPFAAAVACLLLRPRRGVAWALALALAALPVFVLASPLLPQLMGDPLLAAPPVPASVTLAPQAGVTLGGPRDAEALQVAPDASRWAVAGVSWSPGPGLPAAETADGAPVHAGAGEEAGADPVPVDWRGDDPFATEGGVSSWRTGPLPLGAVAGQATAAPVRIGVGDLALLPGGEVLWLARGEDGQRRLRLLRLPVDRDRAALATAPPAPMVADPAPAVEVDPPSQPRLVWEVLLPAPDPLSATASTRLGVTANEWFIEALDYSRAATLVRGPLTTGGPFVTRVHSLTGTDGAVGSVFAVRLGPDRTFGHVWDSGWLAGSSALGMVAQAALASGAFGEPPSGIWVELGSGEPLVDSASAFDLADSGPGDAVVAHSISAAPAFWRVDGPGRVVPLRRAPLDGYLYRVFGRRLVFIDGADVVVLDVDRGSEVRVPGVTPEGTHLRDLAVGGRVLAVLRALEGEDRVEVVAFDLDAGGGGGGQGGSTAAPR